MNEMSAVLLLRGSYQYEFYPTVFKGAIVCLQSKGWYKTGTKSDTTAWKCPQQLSNSQWLLALVWAWGEQQSSYKDYAKITFIIQPSHIWPIKPMNYNIVWDADFGPQSRT